MRPSYYIIIVIIRDILHRYKDMAQKGNRVWLLPTKRSFNQWL